MSLKSPLRQFEQEQTTLFPLLWPLIYTAGRIEGFQEEKVTYFPRVAHFFTSMQRKKKEGAAPFDLGARFLQKDFFVVLAGKKS